MVRSIKGLIRKLGGSAWIAGQLGCSEESIQYWIEDGRIPEGWHFRLHFLAQIQGIEVDPHKVFGLSTAFGRA